AQQNAADDSKGSAWSTFHARVNEAADNFFYRLGYWVATHPKRTLLISLVFVIACCFGFANFRIEGDGEESEKKHDNLGTGRERKEHVSHDVVWSLVVLIEWAGGNTYANVCSKELDGVTCEPVFRGITRFWGDFDTYEASVTSDADILAAVNVTTFPDGSAVNQQALFGNGITYDDYGNISGARAVIQGYALASDPDDDAGINEYVYDWNEAFQEVMAEAADDFDVLDVYYLTSRSTEDALEEAVSGEIFLFITTYVLMVAFVSVVIGRCCSGPVKRRSWLGIGGVMLVVAAGLAAYGLNSGFDIPFTPLSNMLPFILIGIGVDDMFVIVAAYDHTDLSLAVEERVALGVKRCGVSVTYTSLTNFVAFMLGSVSSLPAVEYFCLYAGTAILFDFFLQMTAFVALLTMDANRQKAGKIDSCCCFTSKKYLQEQEGQQQEGIQRGVTLPDSNVESIMMHRRALDRKAEVHQQSSIGRYVVSDFRFFP
ncbi:unnamed protein product, partial [Ectocarpus sp. 8 AP-2014]